MKKFAEAEKITAVKPEEIPEVVDPKTGRKREREVLAVQITDQGAGTPAVARWME